jgi:hypothetical protein
MERLVLVLTFPRSGGAAWAARRRVAHVALRFAASLELSAISPRSPRADEPNFDLAWEAGDRSRSRRSRARHPRMKSDNFVSASAKCCATGSCSKGSIDVRCVPCWLPSAGPATSPGVISAASSRCCSRLPTNLVGDRGQRLTRYEQLCTGRRLDGHLRVALSERRLRLQPGRLRPAPAGAGQKKPQLERDVSHRAARAAVLCRIGAGRERPVDAKAP